MKTKNELLTYLWIFVLLNYLYCDIVGLMDASLLKQYLTGKVGGMNITQEFLLGGAILMEIPIAMILISKFAGFKINKWSNFGAGLIMSLVQFASLLIGKPTNYYLFFSIIEITTTIVICCIGISWKNQPQTSI